MIDLRKPCHVELYVLPKTLTDLPLPTHGWDCITCDEWDDGFLTEEAARRAGDRHCAWVAGLNAEGGPS